MVETLKTVCFLCELRDSEKLTLQPQTVGKLKQEAKEQGIKIVSTHKKADVVAKMVRRRCRCLNWILTSRRIKVPSIGGVCQTFLL